ncbi:MAG TPA: YciI family protein [Micromonosporaceae bacterium]|jgi:hypothetical protein|nr:YciI family protein [Micromonosporaceae bacterium]
MARFVVQLAFKDNDRRLAVRPAHRDYLWRLHGEGRLVTAGPWADDTGAMLIYEVAGEDELAAILADDPYTPAAVCDVVLIREWTPIVP